MKARELKMLVDQLSEEQLDLDVEVVCVDDGTVEHVDIRQSLTSGPAPIYVPPDARPTPWAVVLWINPRPILR